MADLETKATGKQVETADLIHEMRERGSEAEPVNITTTELLGAFQNTLTFTNVKDDGVSVITDAIEQAGTRVQSLQLVRADDSQLDTNDACFNEIPVLHTVTTHIGDERVVQHIDNLFGALVKGNGVMQASITLNDRALEVRIVTINADNGGTRRKIADALQKGGVTIDAEADIQTEPYKLYMS